MSLILFLVMAAGISLSKLMLLAGLTSILLRYPLAALGSYAVFLGVMRMWIWWMIPALARRDVHWQGSAGNAEIPSMDSAGPSSREFRFGGGSSGGAGASMSWDRPIATPIASHSSVADSFSLPFSSSSSSSDDSGEIVWAVLLVVLVLAVVVAVISGGFVYLVYVAPEFMPELVLQALFTAGLIKASQKAQQGHWLNNLVRRTCIPFALVLVAVSLLGYVTHKACPNAVRLSQAFSCGEMR